MIKNKNQVLEPLIIAGIFLVFLDAYEVFSFPISWMGQVFLLSLAITQFKEYKQFFKERLFFNVVLLLLVPQIYIFINLVFSEENLTYTALRFLNIFSFVILLAFSVNYSTNNKIDKEDILIKMKRNYSREEYIKIINKLLKVRPNIKISSDFIVGFPNETDADFQQTMDLIEEVKFDASFSFIYSARPGTPASQLEDIVPLEVKKERLYILQKRIDELQLYYSNDLVNTIQRCLVTGLSKKDINQLQARTECNRVVNFDFQNINILGKLVDIEITKAYQRSLTGKIINSEGAS